MSLECGGFVFPERLQYAGNGLHLCTRRDLEDCLFESSSFSFKSLRSGGSILSDCSELVSIVEQAGGAAVYAGLIRHTGRRRDCYVVIVSVPSCQVEKYGGWAYKFVGDSKFGLDGAERVEIEAVIDSARNYLAKPKN